MQFKESVLQTLHSYNSSHTTASVTTPLITCLPDFQLMVQSSQYSSKNFVFMVHNT